MVDPCERNDCGCWSSYRLCGKFNCLRMALYVHKKCFFAGDDFSPEVRKFKNWLFGIIGGTIVGFHLLMSPISENAFKWKE